MSGFARFILVNYKQDLLGENTVDNTVDQKIALPFYVMLMLHLVICQKSRPTPPVRDAQINYKRPPG